jgi:hypothetical protein
LTTSRFDELRGVDAAKQLSRRFSGILVPRDSGTAGIGKGYMLAGDKRRAVEVYRDFLILSKDADRDIPILRQAHA